jgi:uncharacterized ferredoxin-like protein
VNIKLTDEQRKTIESSLLATVQRAEEQASLALRKGFHDAKQEAEFYENLKLRAESALRAVAVVAVENEADEDTCPECDEDCGFCTCEEEEDEGDA